MDLAIVILVGGKGSRVSHLLNGKSKPELNITKNKKIIDFQIRKIKPLKKKVIFLSNHKFKSFKDYINNKYKKILNFEIIEESMALGTAGALKVLQKKKYTNFLLVDGDLIFNLNIYKLYNFHKKKNSDCTLLVHPNNHPYDSDAIKADDNGKVYKLFNKKFKNKPNNCLSGIKIIKKKCLKFLVKDIFQDFSKDLLPNLLKHRKKVYAYNTREYVKDAGTPKRILQVQKDIKSIKFKNGSLNKSMPAIFIDKDGVLNPLNKSMHYQSINKIFPHVAEGLKKINNSKFLAVLITNQPAIAKGFITRKKFEEDLNFLSIFLGKQNAYLDRIYYCPHYPKKGFKNEIPKLKIKCTCRKPDNGLFLKAIKELNIDVKKSYMIGDQMTDYEAAKKTRIKFVCVNSEYKNNKKFTYKKNFLIAANFIINS